MSAVFIGRSFCRRGTLLACQFQPAAANSSKWLATSAATNTTRPLAEQPNESFWDKNKRLDRPMSPHLTIYKFQVTSVLSVTHRATGISLSALTSGFAIGMLALPGSFPHYLQVLETTHLGSAVLVGAKFTLAFPFVFHFLNGIRHLAWDLGVGFKNKEVSASGFTVVGLSVLSALALAAM